MENTTDTVEDLSRQAAALGMPFLAEVGDELLDATLISGIPVEWARAHAVLPIRRDGVLCLLTADPDNLRQQEDVALALGSELRPVVAPRAVILNCIERCYFSRKGTAADFLRGLGRDGGGAGAEEESRSDDLLKSTEDAPVTQLVNLILLEALKARASDIHVEPFDSRLRVRYRVDGLLYEQASPPKRLERALVSRMKVMAHLDIAEKRLPQDGSARVRVGEREIDVRVSTIPVGEGERVVLRLLNRESSVLPLAALGMPEGVQRTWESLLREAHGLMIVCGPTGSGKTTTLYGSIRQLDTKGRNVLTIEDPVEYQLPEIGQMQVKPKIGLTFAGGLRHILRQDPDVILVGETRDNETAEIAVRASLTGHLVFTTLHTNDAAGAMIRMMDMGVESYLLAAALRGILAQRLVRKLCPSCRKPVAVRAEELALLGEAGRPLAGRTVYEPGGCADCLAGYHGRIGIYELLVVDEAMQEAMRAGTSAGRQLKMAPGMGVRRTLLDDGLAKVLDGRTSLAEVLYALGISGA
jgi:general secretion pathway protein E